MAEDGRRAPGTWRRRDTSTRNSFTYASPTGVIEKVAVTRDDDGDSDSAGAGEELVVVRVGGGRRPQGWRAGRLIRQALSLDPEDAYAAGEAVPPALWGVGFPARALVRATLPHSDPKANELVRRNGHFTLSILAPKDVGLPYGRYPLLVLAYLTTEAVRRKSPDIELSSHFSHFCAAIGIPPTTGPRRSLPQLRDQLQRLFASTFQCIFHDESQGGDLRGLATAS